IRHMRSVCPFAIVREGQGTGDSERAISHAKSASTDLEVVAITCIVGAENAYAILQRAGLNFLLATGVVSVAESSALKEIETPKVPVLIRCYLAFIGVEDRGASGRTDENAVSGIRFQRRPGAVGTAIQINIRFSGVDIAVDLHAIQVGRE